LTEVLPEKFVSPPYTAVIMWTGVIAEILLVLKVATPEAFNVPEPNGAAPSLKVTVPEGLPLAGAATLTVAVKVIGRP
jgi:hypothetical protein